VSDRRIVPLEPQQFAHAAPGSDGDRHERGHGGARVRGEQRGDLPPVENRHVALRRLRLADCGRRVRRDQLELDGVVQGDVQHHGGIPDRERLHPVAVHLRV
jgi:hypothetical protein